MMMCGFASYTEDDITTMVENMNPNALREIVTQWGVNEFGQTTQEINVSERPKEPTWAEKAEAKRRQYMDAAIELLRNLEDGKTVFGRPMEVQEIKAVLDMADGLLCNISVK